MAAATPLVNRWNDWDPLEEIILGIANDACFPPMEPACQSEFNDQHTKYTINVTQYSPYDVIYKIYTCVKFYKVV